jgi:exosortase/archaeosortase family protein
VGLKELNRVASSAVVKRGRPLEASSAPKMSLLRMPLVGGSQPFKFVSVFMLTAAALLAIYYFPYAEGTVMKNWISSYLHAYAAVAGAVLHWFDASVHVDGQDIVGRYSLRIVRTCDAMDVKILFVSAVVAWPAPWRRKAVAAMVGATTLFVVNVARICALYYIGLCVPASFQMAHHELLPALVLVVALGAFILFTAWAQLPSNARSAE